MARTPVSPERPKPQRLAADELAPANDRRNEILGGLTVEDRRQLLTLLRRALDSAPPQPPWRADEAD
jgi:hypothetical protein